MNETSRYRTIFVQIPSYRDPQLIPTLLDMLHTADRPDFIHAVVCWQHADDEHVEAFEQLGFTYMGHGHKHGHRIHDLTLAGSRVRLLDVNYLDSRGCGWARSRIQDHYANEAYALQLDSHHRFAKGWDTLLVEMLESLREASAKPLLTGYPPSFDPSRDPQMRQMDAIQMDFDRFAPPGIMRFKSSPMRDWQNRSEPMRARFLSGGFVFADGCFVREVPNDDGHFFATEEIVMAARAYTNGFDLFHPHRAILWHQYLRTEAVKVWDDHAAHNEATGSIVETAKERAVRGYLRSRKILGMDGDADAGSVDFGRFGLGSVRALQDYERYAGISFRFQGVTQSAIDGLEPNTESQRMPEDAWEDRLICAMDARIRINPSDLDLSLFPDEVLTACIYAADGAEVHRFDLAVEDVVALKEGEVVEYLMGLVFNVKERPLRYAVIRPSADGKWAAIASGRIKDDLIERFLAVAYEP